MTKIDEQELKDAVARGIPSSGGYQPPTHNSLEEDYEGEQTPKRKGRNSAIEEYRKEYLQKTEVAGRQLIYVSEELHAGLIDIVKVIGGKHATLGGYVENILRSHLSEHKELINSVHKTRYKAPVQW